MDISDIFSGPHGVVIAGLMGIVFFSLIFGFKQLKVAEHKWAAHQAAALQALGLSSTVTTPLSDLAAGDIPGAIGSGLAAAKYLEQRENRLKEGLNVLKTIAASHPAEVKQLFTDFLAGAPDSQLTADLTAATKGLPGVSAGPILAHIQHAADVITSLGKHGDLSAFATMIGSNPVLASLAPALTKLMAASHLVGGDAAPAQAAPADAAANTLTIPDGHQVTISKA